MAGAACAAALTAAGVAVTVRERGRAPGGRLASPEVAGRRVDLGASYFTVRDDGFRAVVDGWADCGHARPWTDTFSVAGPDGMEEPKSGPMRWAAPGGLRSLVRDLLAGVDVRLDEEVASVSVEGGRPVVDGEAADMVVLAMPDPQAARLLTSGTVAGDGRDPVEYDPVIAVAAGWARREWPFADGAFVHDHPDVEFVADDGARRGDGAAVLVAHTTAERARRHLDDPDGAVAPVLAALGELFDVRAAPTWTRAHRWSFAKPADAHPRTHLLTDSGIGLAGDSWCPGGSPRVESAWRSGIDLAQAVLRRLG